MKKKIVLYQSSPRIRLDKYSKLFSNMGHEVSCFYIDQDFSLNYDGLDLSHFKEIKKINNLNEFLKFDYIFVIDLVCIRGVIQSLVKYNLNINFLVGDVWFLRKAYEKNGDIKFKTNSFYNSEIEVLKKYAFNKFVFSGNYLRNSISDALKIPNLKKSLVIKNTNFREWINKNNFKEKLSEKDSKYHIVYVGGVTKKIEIHHRNLFDSFDQITQKDFICLHVYPTNHLCDDYPQKKNIIYHERCPVHLLIHEISQYDFGLITFNLNMDDSWYINISEPNKLYDYTFAKLPIICNDVKSYREIIENNNLGECFKDLSKLTEKKLDKIKEKYNFNYNFNTFNDYETSLSKQFFQ